MENNQKKNKIQQEALSFWVKAGKVGTCEIATGIGKTILALHALYTMPKDKLHLFLAETTSRKKDFIDDCNTYSKLFGKNPLKDYNIEFYCYQTVYKYKNKEFGLVIADEIHDSLTPSYSKFYFNNKYDALIGLSATVNRDTQYNDFSKGDLLDKVAPVCYTYNLTTAQAEGTSRKLKVFVITHRLEDSKKTIVAGSKKKPFLQSEKAAYDYWDKEHKKSWFISDEETKKLRIRITSHKRSNILYTLPSKIPVVKKLLSGLKGKSIIFGNSLNSLHQITPNVLSSRQSDKRNDRIREDFDKNRITSIGSFKKLKQGANLKDLDNCIMMSYYSTEKDIIQRMGRLRQNNKLGFVFILLTVGTQEEVWYNKMTENLTEVEQIYCPDVDFALKQYKKYVN